MTLCEHKNLHPFILVYTRRIYPNGYKQPPEFDYSANSLNATELHVKEFICLTCCKIIKAPNIYECEKEIK